MGNLPRDDANGQLGVPRPRKLPPNASVHSKPAPASTPAGGICAECRRDPPDGTERQRLLDDGESLWLHPACENAYLVRRTAEENLAAAPKPKPAASATSRPNGSGPVTDPWPEIFGIRKALWLGGYKIVPNRNKKCVIPGWNSRHWVARELTDNAKGTALEHIERWSIRFERMKATGVMVWEPLLPIDVDVNDAPMLQALDAEIARIAPEVAARAPRRSGGGVKVALFARLTLAPGEDRFTRFASRRYHRPGEPADAPAHGVEIFGGKPTSTGGCSRQFGIYGPRSHDANGNVETVYGWASGRPPLHEVALDALPTLTKAQALEILTAFEALAENKFGWVRVKLPDSYNSNGEPTTAVFDIDENTRFSLMGGDVVDYEGLCTEYYWRGKNLRCASNFIVGDADGVRPDKCQVGELRTYDHAIGVWNWQTGEWHLPKTLGPLDDAQMAKFAVMLRKVVHDNTGTPTLFTPVVKIGPLSKMADAAAEILLAAKVPFYQRGDRLVRPVAVPVQSFHGNVANTAQLVNVELPYMRDMLCRKSIWLKFDGRAKKWLPTHPPSDASQVLLNRYGDWNFPALAGLISTPTLRPDGTVLSRPGYDPATQLLLVDPPAMPEIPDRPSRDDALAALGVIKDLLTEFPFVDAVARAVGLSGMISTVCRGAFPIVPIHLVDAPAAGTGKSYLLSTISWVATGQAMPVLGAGAREEELSKRLDAAVVSGQQLVCIDNIIGEIGGEAICRLTEQWRPQVRILGLTKLINVDARGISFFGNGNNVVVVGDLGRRVIRARLDTQTEHPELREFTRNPMQEILANRGRYIAACLTICRAYHVAGRPGRLSPLASYGEWSDTVRSALVWLGEADPVASMETSKTEDPQANVLLEMLSRWKAEFGVGPGNGRTAREVVNYCDENRRVHLGKDYLHPELRTAVLSVMPTQHRLAPDTIALGCWLRSQKDRLIRGMKFDKQDATGRNPTLWWVDEV